MEILEIILQSDDLEESENFYSDKLGLTIIEKNRNMVSFTTGKSILTFIKSKKIHPVYHFAFHVPKNLFNEAITWVSLKVDILNVDDNNVIADFPSWNARSFYFLDNSGNIVEFIAHFDLDSEMDQPFDSSCILALSEIGIVSHNVTVLTQRLTEEYNIPVYAKQPPKENFTAMGDDHGLLILSQENRNWFPTEIRSRVFYTKAKILVNKKILEITVNNSHTLK